MTPRREWIATVALSVVCGLLIGAAAVLLLGCPSAPPAAPAAHYSSTFSPAGEGCWIETSEKICGAVERHMVVA